MGKSGRPTKDKEISNRKRCMEYYENYQSAGFAAQQLGLNRNTVDKYYQEFSTKEIAETNKSFIERQRMVKNRVLTKIDIFIDKANKQIERFENLLGQEGELSPDGVNFERLLQKSITDVNNLYQQKASLEMTPTLDIHIEAELEKKYGHISENDTITKPKGKSKTK